MQINKILNSEDMPIGVGLIDIETSTADKQSWDEVNVPIIQNPTVYVKITTKQLRCFK